MNLSILDQLEAHTDVTGFCWLWTEPLSYGYGYIKIEGRRERAHRVVYEYLVGPIPDGLVLDHLCRVRHCVNPDHLEPVTIAVNVMRGFGPTATKARKTHCKRGHEFTADNTNVRPQGRECKTCKSMHNAIHNRRRH